MVILSWHELNPEAGDLHHETLYYERTSGPLRYLH